MWEFQRLWLYIYIYIYILIIILGSSSGQLVPRHNTKLRFKWCGAITTPISLFFFSLFTFCWGTIFSLMPPASILFNHIYLFTKKYQNIAHKLFWVSINISHLIGPQIFHISLSKLGHDIYYHKNPRKTNVLSNFIIII